MAHTSEMLLLYYRLSRNGCARH